MKRLTALLFGTGTLLAGGCSTTPANQEHSQIAEACRNLLLSANTNETTIAVNDPRVSPTIVALKPQQILLAGEQGGHRSMVLIIRAGKPSVYEFWARPSYPHMWMLFAAGSGHKSFDEVWTSP
jgi:hypothetical protein